jgi:hypothetical protein
VRGAPRESLAKTLADLYAERDLLDDLGATPAPVCCGSTTGRECAQPDACAAPAHHRSEVGKEQMHPDVETYDVESEVRCIEVMRDPGAMSLGQ